MLPQDRKRSLPKTAQRHALGIAGLALALLLSACGADPASDLPVSAVDDKADILPAEVETSLNARLRTYWENTGNAVVVASVPSLEGKTIEKVAFDTFNSWGNRDAETNRGILLLVAPNERMVRIEVGCGLESVITNDAATEVIQNNIFPHFQQGDIARGTTAGVEVLVSLLDKGKDPHPVSERCLANMKKAA
jgi:uncharacterized protein